MLARPFDEVWGAHRDKVRRLVDHLAGRSPSSSCLRDDMLAAATEGLWEASLGFDASRGPPLWTFAFLHVRGRALDVLRDHDVLTRHGRKAAKEGAPPEPWSLREGVGLDELVSYPADSSDPEAEVIAREEAALLRRAVSELPGRLRRAVEGVLAGERLRSVAASLGVSESRVSQVVSKAEEILRTRLRGEVGPSVKLGPRMRRRRFSAIEHEGKTLKLAEWAGLLGVAVPTLRARLRAGWPVGRALTEPVSRGRRPRPRTVV